MQRHLLQALAILLVATAAQAAPTIELELATERGLQITAPREWLQLLTSIGIQNVRIRGAQSGDAPAVTNRGTSEQPSYHVVGILTAREQLHLPGGTFGRGDAARLKDYFDRLTADGDVRLTAPRGHFGLTQKEFVAVLTELTQPIEFETKDQPPRAVLERLTAKFQFGFSIDIAADRILRDAKPVADELKGISAGTGLAILLRASGLTLRPEKLRGQPITYRIEASGALPTVVGRPAAGTRERAGKLDDLGMTSWPVGWEAEKAPGAIAPSLFEKLNAEIAGYTLAETLAAVGPRLKVPYYLDHAALAADKIDPAAIEVKLAPARMSYKRLLDRVLAQARLGSDLRADEAGTVFLWITR